MLIIDGLLLVLGRFLEVTATLLLVLLIVLGIIPYVPALTLWLPNAVFG